MSTLLKFDCFSLWIMYAFSWLWLFCDAQLCMPSLGFGYSVTPNYVCILLALLRNAYTKSGSLRFSQFFACWLICLFIYLWVFTFPLEDCLQFGNFVITFIYQLFGNEQHSSYWENTISPIGSIVTFWHVLVAILH